MVNIFGTAKGYIDVYALRRAAFIQRVLLPACIEDSEDCRYARWEEVARAFHRAGRVHGLTSWSALTELPGDGAWRPCHEYRPAGGIINEHLCSMLVDVLESAAGPINRWHQRSSVLRGASRSPLLSALDAGPRAVISSDAMEGGIIEPRPLRELAATWPMSGLPLRAWSVESQYSMAAPEYADSLIVSSPIDLTHAFVEVGFEAFPVLREDKCPIETH